MNKIYRFTGVTLGLIAVGMWWGRRFELNKMFTDNDYLNRVWQQQYKGSDDRIFVSNQPWI
jgi:hypothetical protein